MGGKQVMLNISSSKRSPPVQDEVKQLKMKISSSGLKSNVQELQSWSWSYKAGATHRALYMSHKSVLFDRAPLSHSKA